MPRRAPISVPGIASSASQNTFSFDETAGDLQDQRGAEHGAVEDLEDAAALILGPAAYAGPQGRKRARQPGEAAENAAGKSDAGIGDAAAEAKGHRLADEIERGRKHQQHHADAELEGLRIGARDQQRPDRHAEESAGHERQSQLEVEQLPHRRQCRDLRADRTDQHQRHGNRRRQDVKPDPQRHQRRAEAGKSGDEAAGERAGKQDRVGGQVHSLFSRHSVIPGRSAASRPGISKFRVWSFGPSRNDDDEFAPTFTRQRGQVLSQSKPSTIT